VNWRTRGRIARGYQLVKYFAGNGENWGLNGCRGGLNGSRGRETSRKKSKVKSLTRKPEVLIVRSRPGENRDSDRRIMVVVQGRIDGWRNDPPKADSP